jgi:hypothetical protein
VTLLSVREFAKESGQASAAGPNLSVRLMAKNLLQPSPISVKHLIQFLGGPFPGSMPSLATLYLTQHFQVVCALVGVDGRFYWTGAGGFDPWYAPHSVGTPFAPVGANVALALLPYSVPNNQPAVGIIIAVVIGNDGRLQSLWSDGKKDQQGFPAPAAIGTPFSQPGGGVALAEQNGTVTAVAIGNDGKLYAASVPLLPSPSSASTIASMLLRSPAIMSPAPCPLELHSLLPEHM